MLYIVCYMPGRGLNTLINKVKRTLCSPVLIRLLTVCLSFISGVFINRSLGLELKGQYTIITNYANFIQLLVNCGICYVYPVLKRENGNRARKVVSTLIWIQTFFMVLISVIMLCFCQNIKSIQIVILSTLQICNSQIIFIALIENIGKRNLVLLLSTILYIFLNAIMFIFKRGKLDIVICLLVIKYLFEIVLCGRIGKIFNFDLKLIDTNVRKKIFSVGFPTAVLAILISCNYNLDIMLLNWMRAGNIEIGIYGVAYSLSNMLWIIPDVFKELVYNKTAQTAVDGKLILKYIVLNMLICFGICLGFVFLGRLFLLIIYGEQYVQAFETTITLFIGIIPMVSFKLIHPIYVNEGKSIIVSVLLAVAVISNIISSYLLIPIYGAFGAAIASVIAYSICGVLFLIKYWNDYYRKE